MGAESIDVVTLRRDTGVEIAPVSRESATPTWWVATALLVVMAAVFLVTLSYEQSVAWLPPVRAFAEAALVGALADWFAVTALFRHPLGLPIPHTAIIPRNKARIGKSIGSFVQNNFLSRSVLEGEALNISGMIARWLEQPSNRKLVTGRVREFVPSILEAVQDDEVRHFIDRQVEDVIRRVDICRVAGKLLRLFTANEMHEVVFEEFVGQGRGFFRANQDWFRQQLHNATPWFVPEFVDRRIFEAIAARTDKTLAEAMADRNHELRKRVHQAVESFIERLEHGEEFQRRGEELRELLLKNELFRGYLNSLRDAVIADMRADLQREDSQIAGVIERIMEQFVTAMASSPELPEKINKVLAQVILAVVGERSTHVADLISRTVDSWDTTTVVSKFEEQVGRDLQYIRINGTLVGGLVGLLLYYLSGVVR